MGGGGARIKDERAGLSVRRQGARAVGAGHAGAAAPANPEPGEWGARAGARALPPGLAWPGLARQYAGAGEAAPGQPRPAGPAPGAAGGDPQAAAPGAGGPRSPRRGTCSSAPELPMSGEERCVSGQQPQKGARFMGS